MTVVNTDPMPFIHPTHSGHSLFCWHIRCVTSVLCDEIQAIHFFLPTPAGVIAEKAFRLAGCTHARRKIFLLEPVCVCLCVFAWLVGGWWAVVCPVRCGSRLPSGSNGQWLCAFRVVSCRVMSFHSVSSPKSWYRASGGRAVCLVLLLLCFLPVCVCVCGGRIRFAASTWRDTTTRCQTPKTRGEPDQRQQQRTTLVVPVPSAASFLFCGLVVGNDGGSVEQRHETRRKETRPIELNEVTKQGRNKRRSTTTTTTIGKNRSNSENDPDEKVNALEGFRAL